MVIRLLCVRSGPSFASGCLWPDYGPFGLAAIRVHPFWGSLLRYAPAGWFLAWVPHSGFFSLNKDVSGDGLLHFGGDEAHTIWEGWFTTVEISEADI